MKTFSKYSKGITPKPAKQQEEPKKTRKARSHRFFRYRDVAFIATRDGDKVHVQVFDEVTKTARPGVYVPNGKVGTAKKAFAKIALAERDLEEIALPPPDRTDSDS